MVVIFFTNLDMTRHHDNTAKCSTYIYT